jgi:mRNA-degrading endonuclease HigB of HigAB toxin-antitoxin module
MTNSHSEQNTFDAEGRSLTPTRGLTVRQEQCHRPQDIKVTYGNASFTGNNRVVFNIKGNDYRLVVAVRDEKGLMYVRFVGSHRQHDKIDVETI